MVINHIVLFTYANNARLVLLFHIIKNQNFNFKQNQKNIMNKKILNINKNMEIYLHIIKNPNNFINVLLKIILIKNTNQI